ncbi:MAG: hypothetical protein LC775_15715 [Acidobacteria bacterium]|nr:hypothetical protein [Acidobacteriota bacterium]
MAANGIIRPVERLPSSPRSRRLLLHRILGNCDPENALNVLATWVNQVFVKASRWASWGLAVLAAIFAVMLFFAGRRNGVFLFLAPEGLNVSAQREWLLSFYFRIWWALL